MRAELLGLPGEIPIEGGQRLGTRSKCQVEGIGEIHPAFEPFESAEQRDRIAGVRFGSPSRCRMALTTSASVHP